jgi:hypothetical protein
MVLLAPAVAEARARAGAGARAKAPADETPTTAYHQWHVELSAGEPLVDHWRLATPSNPQPGRHPRLRRSSPRGESTGGGTGEAGDGTGSDASRRKGVGATRIDDPL